MKEASLWNLPTGSFTPPLKILLLFQFFIGAVFHQNTKTDWTELNFLMYSLHADCTHAGALKIIGLPKKKIKKLKTSVLFALLLPAGTDVFWQTLHVCWRQKGLREASKLGGVGVPFCQIKKRPKTLGRKKQSNQ